MQVFPPPEFHRERGREKGRAEMRRIAIAGFLLAIAAGFLLGRVL